MGKKRRKRDHMFLPTFSVVTICWSARTVTVNDRAMSLPDDVDCISFPITDDTHVHGRSGWFRL